MKERNSFGKAKWSSTREVDYKQMCQKILFERKEEIVISEGNAYLKTNNTEELLMEIEDKKKTWYKIWCKLEHGW